MPLNTPSLTIVDNEDGTATATIAGATAGTTNTLYTQVADGNLRTPAWVSRGSRVGDGTIANFSIGVGLYWAYVLSSGGGESTLSPLAYFGATDGLADIHERCVQAVVSRLQSLTFAGTTNSPAGVPAANIYDRLLPLDLHDNFPNIQVTIEGVPDDIRDATNLREDYVLPVNVVVADQNDSGDFKKTRPKYLRWRNQIKRAFVHQRLPGVTEVHDCEVRPGVIIDPKLSERAYVGMGLTLMFLARLTRGLT